MCVASQRGVASARDLPPDAHDGCRSERRLVADSMDGRCFLATFRPLIHSRGGREAVRRYGLPPFIDGSCRREPDLESLFPSITATCRAGKFAPRLAVGDRIGYLTVKGRYLDQRQPHWRLVAVLRVVQRFESHPQAAEWYVGEGLSVPSNCLVEGNPPKAFEFTNGMPPADVKARLAEEADPEKAIRLWDAGYRRRVAQHPTFLATQPEFLELHRAPEIHHQDLLTIFGSVPATLNPPVVSCLQLDALLQLAGGRAA
jgi:hypothetical protein